MNDVREICALALAEPAPPLRPATEALTAARRATRRRHRLAAAGSAALVLATAGSVATLPAARPAPTIATPVAAAAPVALVIPTVPSWQAAQRNGHRIAATLQAAVPAGFVTVAEFPSANGPTATWLIEPESPERYGSMTSLVVSDGPRQGSLQAIIFRDGATAPTGNLCSAAVAARIDPVFGPLDRTEQCRVVVSNGIPVRLTTWNDPDVGRVSLAVRMLDGGLLGVEETQGRFVYNGGMSLPPDATHTAPDSHANSPRLAGPVLTNDQVAALAVNPGLLP